MSLRIEDGRRYHDRTGHATWTVPLTEGAPLWNGLAATEFGSRLAWARSHFSPSAGVAVEWAMPVTTIVGEARGTNMIAVAKQRQRRSRRLPQAWAPTPERCPRPVTSTVRRRRIKARLLTRMPATTPARSRSDVSGIATGAERHRQSSVAPSRAKCCTSMAGSISKA